MAVFTIDRLAGIFRYPIAVLRAFSSQEFRNLLRETGKAESIEDQLLGAGTSTNQTSTTVWTIVQPRILTSDVQVTVAVLVGALTI